MSSLLNSNSEIYYNALALLYVLKNQNDYSDISRLALILDESNFNKLIDNCGGMTITIPTRDEVNVALKALIFYQLRYDHHMSFAQAVKESELSIQEAKAVEAQSKNIRRFFRSLSPLLKFNR